MRCVHTKMKKPRPFSGGGSQSTGNAVPWTSLLRGKERLVQGSKESSMQLMSPEGKVPNELARWKSREKKSKKEEPGKKAELENRCYRQLGINKLKHKVKHVGNRGQVSTSKLSEGFHFVVKTYFLKCQYGT